jgi:hypothetical protein
MSLIDKFAEQSFFENICYSSGVRLFDSNLRPLLEEILKELCRSNIELVSRIRVNHFDRAIFKFRQAKEKTCIRNTKQYFKACIISAVNETAFDALEPIE